MKTLNKNVTLRAEKRRGKEEWCDFRDIYRDKNKYIYKCYEVFKSLKDGDNFTDTFKTMHLKINQGNRSKSLCA